MSIDVSDLLTYTDDLLNTRSYSDYCPIGLQVSGTNKDVTSIATAVSCTLDVFNRAAELNTQLLLVHHGLFWKGMSQVITPLMRDRLQILFTNGITLAGYHLPLDGHAELGNNALLCRDLGLIETARFAEHGGNNIGIIGEYTHKPLSADEFFHKVKEISNGRSPLVLGTEPKSISRVAVCSGGAASSLEEAASLGCDALITGEPREDSLAFANELGITLYAAGHQDRKSVV